MLSAVRHSISRVELVGKVTIDVASFLTPTTVVAAVAGPHTRARARAGLSATESLKPVQHGCGGPRLVHASQRLAGEWCVVLGERAVGRLA